MRFKITEAKKCRMFTIKDAFFERNFPIKIKKRIQQDIIKRKWDLSCVNESLFWAKKIESYGVDPYDIEMIEGYYKIQTEDEDFNSDFDLGEGHTWVKVQGFIFDPTRGQFDDFPGSNDTDQYDEQEAYSLEDYKEWK